MSADRELRNAAVLLAADLPGDLSAQPRLVAGDGETISAIAWCAEHPKGDYGAGGSWADTACDMCETVEFYYEPLAALVFALLRARKPLASLLADEARMHEALPEGECCDALTIARAVNGEVTDVS